MKFIRNEAVDAAAERCLARYTAKTGLPLTFPVPVENLLGQVYELSVSWEEIEELNGETVLGGIRPSEHVIVLNQKHLPLFTEKPGLERSTMGHEAGHWEFHVDKASIGHPSFLDELQPKMMLRSATGGSVVVFNWDLMADIVAAEKRRDTPDEERVANRFAAALTMPAQALIDACNRISPTSWENLYRLRQEFDVTITALTVRLDQLGLAYVDDQKNIYKNRKEAAGQLSLFQ